MPWPLLFDEVGRVEGLEFDRFFIFAFATLVLKATVVAELVFARAGHHVVAFFLAHPEVTFRALFIVFERVL